MIGVSDIHTDLLDETQVSELTGLSLITVKNYRQHRSGRKYRVAFPEPIRYVGHAPLYLRSDVEGWLSRRPRRQGGPGKPRPQQRGARARVTA